MLHVQQHGEEERWLQVLGLDHFGHADQENAEQQTIVLEVDVIDDKQTEVAHQQECKQCVLMWFGAEVLQATVTNFICKY